MRIQPCWSCGTKTPRCSVECECAKCIDPEDYARWRCDNPEEYRDWLESQREDDPADSGQTWEDWEQ